MSILIVDDTKSIRALIEHHLVSAGYGPVLHAASGDEALQILGIQGFGPLEPTKGIELILMDVVMPGMDGLETLRRLRDSGAPGSMPVAMITSDLSPANLQAAFEAGANEVIPKPLDKSVLLERTARLLQGAAAGA